MLKVIVGLPLDELLPELDPEYDAFIMRFPFVSFYLLFSSFLFKLFPQKQYKRVDLDFELTPNKPNRVLRGDV